MIINYNSMAANSLRQLNINSANQAKSMAKLSSGLRINSASDDAAGLTISESMKGQIRGLDQASRNAQDGISMTQTAEGALGETTDILQRMRELAVQGSNDTNTSTDRTNIQKEMDQLTSQINGIGNTTEFNNQKLLNGSKDGSTAVAGVYNVTAGNADITIDGVTLKYAADGSADFKDNATLEAAINGDTTLKTKYSASVDASGNLQLTQLSGSSIAPQVSGTDATVATVTEGHTAGTGTGVQLQIGANQAQSMTLDFSDMRASALGLTGSGTGFTSNAGVTDGTSDNATQNGLDVSNAANASNAITVIDNAINQVSSERAKMGAYENRLSYTNDNLTASSQNISDAQSRIADVDMAAEMSKESQSSVLAQAAQAMVAQANQQPQQVLQLLR